jgi:hypothetical protein
MLLAFNRAAKAAAKQRILEPEYIGEGGGTFGSAFFVDGVWGPECLIFQ